MVDEPQQSSYEGLIAALRARRAELDLSAAEVDRAARLPEGSCLLVEAEALDPNSGRKRPIDWTKLFKIAKVLGLKFRLTRSRPVDSS